MTIAATAILMTFHEAAPNTGLRHPQLDALEYVTRVPGVKRGASAKNNSGMEDELTMYISHIALNRIVEEHAAKDESYRRQLARNRRPLLSHGRAMSDEELLAKLRDLGLSVQGQKMRDRFAEFLSAESMAKAITAEADAEIPDFEIDWVWIVVTCLWERWCRQLPNMEMIDDKMQAGYAANRAFDDLQAAQLWLETWHAVVAIAQRFDIRSIGEFDDCFGGTNSVFNWIQDLETALHNAGRLDPDFFHERISLCETVLGGFSREGLPIGNFKSAMAESFFELGDHERGDRLFRDWLQETPQWGWGWIAWSDCYWLFAKPENKDAERAEQILQQGLACPDVEDRTHLLERLQTLYEETDRNDEAETVREALRRSQPSSRATTTPAVSPSSPTQYTDRTNESLDHVLRQSKGAAGLILRLPPNLPAVAQVLEEPAKVGRNAPCPCGSGKKFKKCCGRKPR